MKTSAGWRVIALSAMLLTQLKAIAAEDVPATEIRVLTDRSEFHLAPLFASYEKEAHVSIKAVYLDNGLLSRLDSRPVEADVVITKDAELLEIAKQKHLLQPFSSPGIKTAVPEEFRDPENFYFSDSYRARVIFYSKDRVNPAELSTYEDLANKKWKGRICIRSGYYDYNLSLFGQMLVSWGPERTRNFLKGLSANLARTPSGNDRDQMRAIYEKKCDVAIANSYYMGVMLATPDQKEWGLATRVFFPNRYQAGTFILRSGLALTQAKGNVAAAIALLEYMVRENVQEMIADQTFEYPVVHLQTPLPEIIRKLGEGQPGIVQGRFRIHMVPLPAIARQRDAVIRMLDELQFDKPR